MLAVPSNTHWGFSANMMYLWKVFALRSRLCLFRAREKIHVPFLFHFSPWYLRLTGRLWFYLIPKRIPNFFSILHNYARKENPDILHELLALSLVTVIPVIMGDGHSRQVLLCFACPGSALSFPVLPDLSQSELQHITLSDPTPGYP